jgi:hypothetical protein
MILYSSFHQKYFRLVWAGLTVARLQDEKGKNTLMSMADLQSLMIENKKATVEAVAQ